MQSLSIGQSFQRPAAASKPVLVTRPDLTVEREQVTQWGLPNDGVSVVERGCSKNGRARTSQVQYIDWCRAEANRLREQGRDGKVIAKLQASVMADGKTRRVKMVAVFARVPIDSSLPNKDVD